MQIHVLFMNPVVAVIVTVCYCIMSAAVGGSWGLSMWPEIPWWCKRTERLCTAAVSKASHWTGVSLQQNCWKPLFECAIISAFQYIALIQHIWDLMPLTRWQKGHSVYKTTAPSPSKCFQFKSDCCGSVLIGSNFRKMSRSFKAKLSSLIT